MDINIVIVTFEKNFLVGNNNFNSILGDVIGQLENAENAGTNGKGNGNKLN